MLVAGAGRGLQVDDSCRLRIEPEVEGQLAGARGLQATQGGTEGRALLHLAGQLPQGRQVAEREIGVGVVLERRLDQAALLQIAQVIETQRRIHGENVLLPVVLGAAFGDRRLAGQAAELVFAAHANARRGLGVDLRHAAQLLVLGAGVVEQHRQVGRTVGIAGRADHEERGAHGDFFIGRAAKLLDQGRAPPCGRTTRACR